MHNGQSTVVEDLDNIIRHVNVFVNWWMIMSSSLAYLQRVIPQIQPDGENPLRVISVTSGWRTVQTDYSAYRNMVRAQQFTSHWSQALVWRLGRSKRPWTSMARKIRAKNGWIIASSCDLLVGADYVCYFGCPSVLVGTTFTQLENVVGAWSK